MSRGQRGIVMAGLGMSGYAAMVQEVLWFRSLRMVVGSSTYALTLMLLTFLVGLALGSFLVARFSQRVHRPVLLLAGLQGALAVSVLGAVSLYPSLPGLFLRGFLAFGTGNGVFFLQAALAALVLLPSTMLLGALFPLSAGVFASQRGRLGAEVGTLYAILTCGNVLGATAAIAWLAELGLSGGLLAVAALHGIASIVLWLIAETRSRLRFGLATATATILFLIPLARREWQPLITTSGVFQNANFVGTLFDRPEEFFRSLSVFRLLFYREGVTATVSVYEEPSLQFPRHLSLAIDGKVDASTGEDMSTQVLLAHLPLLLFPEAEDICVIGWGSGITVGSALRYPVSEVTAIEIEPAVLEASSLFDEFSYRPRLDARLRLVVEDARTVLLRENRRYEVIISEPSNPWLTGSSKLFTREFLELGKSRLRAGGIFAQWIHLYGLDTSLLQMFLRTFHSVFPHVLVFHTSEVDLLLLGSERRLLLDPGRITEWIQLPAIREDLERIGVADAEDLLMRFRFGERELSDFAGSGILNTDARPVLEFGAARTLYQDTLLENVWQVLRAFRSLTAYLSSGQSERVVTAVALRALRRGEESAARMFAQELPGTPFSPRVMWLFGEFAWRQKKFATSESWWRRGLETDPSCFGCAIGAALLLQQENRFLEAERVLAGVQRDSVRDPWIALLRGINRYYLGDRTGSASWFRFALESKSNLAEDDIRSILENRMFPSPVLAAFYATEVTASGQTSTEKTDSESIERILARWRLDLFQNPSLDSWAGLLSAIEFHTSRATALKTEQKLVTLVTREVLEPLWHFHRGLRNAQMGDREEAQKEFAEAARRIQDPEGQRHLQETIGRLLDQEPVLY